MQTNEPRQKLTPSVKTIMVVEDDALVGVDLCATITNFGYSVHGPITSGEEVLKTIDSISPDLILMDINLAGEIDGIETILKLQNKHPLPVVFLSSINDESTLQRARLANPYGYLIKPYDRTELQVTIALTLDRSDSLRYAQQNGLSSPDEDSGALEIDPTIESSGSFLRVIEQLPIFDGIPKKELTNLATDFKLKSIDVGQFLVVEGEDTKEYFIPISGRIGLTKTSITGKDLVVALLPPGDPSGLLNNLVSGDGNTSARAQIDSRVITISASRWRQFLETNPLMYRNISSALNVRLARAYELSSALAHVRAECRIISALLSLIPQFGKHTGANTNQGRIHLTRKELSEITGTTPETAIRVTKNLAREGLLDLTRPGIIKILDLDKLRAMIY